MGSDSKILIIKSGTKLPNLSVIKGDFEDWMMSSMQRDAADFMVIDVAGGETLPDPGQVSGVLITGSGAMVTDHSEWIELSAAWLKAAVKQSVPVLGVCFGHQLLAYALGGEVDYNPLGVEVGTVKLSLDEAAQSDVLFKGLNTLEVQASHRQIVVGLPPGAVRLGITKMDACHVFRYGKNVWGVQFHPEFNMYITREYIRWYQDDLRKAELDPELLLSDCHETLQANSLLFAFSQQIGGK